MSDTKLFAVTGKPVLHSQSPQIFNRLFLEMGIDAHYLRLAAANAEEAMRNARALGLHGLNVTSPFKEEIIALLNGIDSHANEVMAVNCLVRNRDSFLGFNTDYLGVLEALRANGVDPKNKRIAVLGAGGAGRAAVYGLIKARASRVTLLNRSVERAKNIAGRMGCRHAPIQQAKEVFEECDIVISCLPTDYRIIRPPCMKKTQVVLDGNYISSSIIKNAKAKGCRTIDGLQWLVHQALPAFKEFTGREIPEWLSRKIVQDIRQSKPAKKPNIALIGFMGSGKTEVGKRLAFKMQHEHIDTDSVIHKAARKPIKEIFTTWGESSFRWMESSVIRKAIPGSRRCVFSFGGGAVLDPENVKIIREYCHVVWLWVSAATIKERVKTAERPLLGGANSLSDIEQLLKKRFPFYAQASELVIANEFCDANQIAERIKNEMDQAFGN